MRDHLGAMIISPVSLILFEYELLLITANNWSYYDLLLSTRQ